ncbi:dephospho-CoA kinase [Peptoniphilus catoniae]|uniref:dephospho-CoA kinase n=1 Tax=Peptoniphilus catoniae TaxID=1660341 RepID=UPI0010FF38B6|nr:dephospho-CoA kinase [Peptoniphilus catoniae]
MKQNKKIIALTGSISTGKSTVANLIRNKGYEVIDLDKIGHDLLNDKEIIREIESAFNTSFSKKGEFKRSLLSKYVFKSKDRLNILNSITHKRIFEKLNYLINKSQEKIIFVDMPLLIELIDTLDQYEFSYDEIWLVYSSPDTQIKRLMKRDKIKEEEALIKIKSQLSIDEKKKYADKIINNESDLQNLENQVEEFLKNLNK